MKKNKGITLIALIITIIILLILVGVSLNLLIKGDLFGSAEKAVEGTNAKVNEQQTRVDELMGELDEVEREIEEQERQQEETEKQKNLPGTRVTENTKYIRNGKTAWIPKGYYHMYIYMNIHWNSPNYAVESYTLEKIIVT